MSIQSQIEAIIQKHNELIAQHPAIRQVEWMIEDVPFMELKEFRENHNKNITEQNESHYLSENGIVDKIHLYLHSWILGVEKCMITICSKRVKFKTSVEVIEDIAD